MFDVYFIFRSVTHGQAGKTALDRSGIPNRLIRSPRELAPAGCAYALTVRGRDLALTQKLFAQEGMRPVSGFRRTQDGSWARLEP